MKAAYPFDDRLVRLCFYLLLPGFFLYHFLVGKEFIPGLLRGYSTAMSSLLLLPLGLVYVRHLLRSPEHRRPLAAIYLGFVLYYAIVLMLQLALGRHGNAVFEQGGIVVQFLSLYILAVLAPLGERRFQRWLLGFFIAMTAIIVFNADEGTFVVAALDLIQTADFLANYQAYAFVYSVVMLYVLAPVRQRWMRLLVYLIGVPTLFLNGARTEFIGVLLMILLIEFLQSRHKLVTLMVTAALVGVAAMALPWLAELYPESRTVFLFIDYSDDRSASERSRMLADGLDGIMQSPWLGSFGSHAPGEHIHNALSAWGDLGVFGFAAYVCLIAVPLLDVCLLRRPQLRNPCYRLAFSLVFLTALFAATAKHFTHQLFPLAIGVYTRFVIEEQRRRQAMPAQFSAFGAPA